MKPIDNQNELFVVVDRDDNILGYKTRAECHSNKSLIHRVAHVAVFNNKGEILLQKRSLKKDLLPGYYTLSATGHVAKGEGYKDAALRELNEELGISLPVYYREKFIVETDQESEFVSLFTTQSEGPFKINKDELEEIKFFKKNELEKLINKLTPHAQVSLQKLNFI